MAGTAALAVVVLALVGCTPEEQTVYHATNQARAARGLPGLGWDEPAYAKAQAWSKHMADRQELAHSNLAAGLPAGWTVLGENVAVSSSPEQAAAQLRASPLHLANMVNPRFTRTAVGVVERDGAYWVTQIFIG